MIKKYIFFLKNFFRFFFRIFALTKINLINKTHQFLWREATHTSTSNTLVKEVETFYIHFFIVHLQNIRCRMKSWPYRRSRLPLLVAGEGFHSLLKYRIYSRPHNKILTEGRFSYTDTDIHKERSFENTERHRRQNFFLLKVQYSIKYFDDSITVPSSRSQINLDTYLSWFREKKGFRFRTHRA